MLNQWQRLFLFFAGLFGALSIILAAAGAHALHTHLDAEHLLETFAKATDYAIYHALALLGLVAIMHFVPLMRFRLIGMAWVLGTLLFSGSLFFYTLTGIRDVVMLTPIGGVTLIVGWLLLTLSIFLPKKTTVPR